MAATTHAAQTAQHDNTLAIALLTEIDTILRAASQLSTETLVKDLLRIASGMAMEAHDAIGEGA